MKDCLLQAVDWTSHQVCPCTGGVKEQADCMNGDAGMLCCMGACLPACLPFAPENGTTCSSSSYDFH